MDLGKVGEKVVGKVVVLFKEEFNEERFVERLAGEVIFPELEAMVAATPNKFDDVALSLMKETILKALKL